MSIAAILDNASKPVCVCGWHDLSVPPIKGIRFVADDSYADADGVPMPDGFVSEEAEIKIQACPANKNTQGETNA